MKAVVCVIVLCLLVSLPAAAQLGHRETVLDRLAGNWVMRGTIAGGETTHDIDAEWVLARHYLRFHEVAREKDDSGTPAYEAIVFIGWDEITSRFACLWLDVTGGGGLSNDAIGYAEPGGDELAFVFDMGEGSVIHTTFTYNRGDDTWLWSIDTEKGGERKSFARVTLTRG